MDIKLRHHLDLPENSMFLEGVIGSGKTTAVCAILKNLGQTTQDRVLVVVDSYSAREEFLISLREAGCNTTQFWFALCDSTHPADWSMQSSKFSTVVLAIGAIRTGRFSLSSYLGLSEKVFLAFNKILRNNPHIIVTTYPKHEIENQKNSQLTLEDLTPRYPVATFSTFRPYDPDRLHQ